MFQATYQSNGGGYMNINKKILGLSAVISLLTVYIFPGRVLDEFKIGFGYPGQVTLSRTVLYLTWYN